MFWFQEEVAHDAAREEEEEEEEMREVTKEKRENETVESFRRVGKRYWRQKEEKAIVILVAGV